MSNLSKVVGSPNIGKVSNVGSSSIRSVAELMLSSAFYGNYSYYINGSLVDSVTSDFLADEYKSYPPEEFPSIVNPVSPTQLIISTYQEGAHTYPSICRVDNLMISSDVNRSLYPLRMSNSKPSGSDIVLYWRLDADPDSFLLFTEGDYAVYSDSVGPWIWGMNVSGVDTTNFVQGNGAGYIYHSTSSDDSYTLGFYLDHLTNLPLKGRVGFHIRLGEVGDNRTYENSICVGVGSGLTTSGWSSNSSFIGACFNNNMTDGDPKPFFCSASAFSESYRTLWGFGDESANLVAGTWYFVEFVYDLTRS